MTPEEFQALPVEDRRSSIRAVGRSDREGLSAEELAALEAADRRAAEVAAKLPPVKVTDLRSRPKPQQAI